MTDEETERLLAMAEHWHRTGHGASDVLHHGLLVMSFTGLRVGELLALSYDDLDLDADPPTLTARHTLTEPRSGTGAGIGPTKGGTVDIIALHDRAADVLRQRAARASDSAKWVFGTRNNRPVSAANLRRALRDLVRGTDLSWVHPHSLRATLATKADMHHDLAAARDLLRHKNEAVTRRHYVESDGVRVLDPRSLFPPRPDSHARGQGPASPQHLEGNDQ